MARTPRAANKEEDPKQAEAAPKVEAALRKKRSARSFPASTFEEPLEFAAAVLRIGSGQPVKRLTLFDQLGDVDKLQWRANSSLCEFRRLG